MSIYNNDWSVGYAVDIVFVIDTTGSMRSIIEDVKHAAMNFHDDLAMVMNQKEKSIGNLRVRVVAYRDYLDNPSDALRESPFFSLPTQRAEFDNFVRSLAPAGGGDEPESGLEGLAAAFLSDWERGMDKRRHLVVLFTDASAHPIEHSASRGLLPPTFPNSMSGLYDLWEAGQGGGMEHAAKRLLMYAPDAYPWNELSDMWSNTLHFPSKAGKGLEDFTFAEILNQIASSV
jgi:hypothetical protein